VDQPPDEGGPLIVAEKEANARYQVAGGCARWLGVALVGGWYRALWKHTEHPQSCILT